MTGLRFAFLTTFYPPYHFGGDAIYVRRLAHALARRGHHVTIIYDQGAYGMLHRGAEPQPLEEPAGVVVHALRSRFDALSCLLTHQAGTPVVHGSRIRRILAEGFDVIHFHNVSLVGGPGILNYGSGIKLYTAHEHWLVCPSHTLWRHNRELCTGRECLRCVLSYGRPPQWWRHGSYLANQCRNVDAFLTLTESCASRHREYGFPFPFRIHPPFLPEAAPLEAAKEGSERPYFLFVGRLEIIKGLQDVIPAFPADCELWIAGKGTYEGELRRLAAGKPNVRFLGQARMEQLRVLYRHARALIVPSVCYEVFPMVVLEAFREGTPIIARNLAPFPEIIRQSSGGVLFSTGEELKQAICSLAGDDVLRERLGASARSAFESRWTEQASVNEYFRIIDSAR